jgi:hypothetical protein
MSVPINLSICQSSDEKKGRRTSTMSFSLGAEDEDEYAKWRTKDTKAAGGSSSGSSSAASAAPQSFEDFYAWLMRRSARRKLASSQDPAGTR